MRARPRSWAGLLVLAFGLPLFGAVAPARAAEPPVGEGRLVYSREDKLGFDLAGYLRERAPHLLPYEEAISHWCGYTTISPRIALSLIELESGLVTAERPAPERLARPLGPLTAEVGFGAQLESVLARLANELYRRLAPEAALGPADRSRAASAALAAVLAGPGAAEPAARQALARFVAVHRALFPEAEPLSRPVRTLARREAPRGYFQLPYPVGQAWLPSILHSDAAGFMVTGTSSLDFSSTPFSPVPPPVGGPVVASHPGRVKVHSRCFVEVLGDDGWSTSYYHLDGVAVADGDRVVRDQLLAVEAVERTQALCQGGQWSGPHVHFTLHRNGGLASLDGVELSGWRVALASEGSLCTHTSFSEAGKESCPGIPLRNDGVFRRLRVVKEGDGYVASAPGGIDCGRRCEAGFPHGSVIQLAAVPAEGSVFAGWSGGGCSGTGRCRLILESADRVTARFEAEVEEDPWLTTPALPGFRVRARFTVGDEEIDGTAVADCIAETLCVAGAVPGRAELFVRVVGPRPNGYLWPTLVKFSTSPIDVWVERTATGEVQEYRLAGAAPGQAFLSLEGLADREGFRADAGAAAAARRRALRAREVAAPPAGPWLESPSLPGFRAKVRITAGAEAIDGAAVADCIAETLCVSGALPDRAEVFLRVVGPKPNGRLWPTLVKFSTSQIEVWLEQISTGAVRSYRLAPAVPGQRLIPLEGLAHRQGFAP